MGPKKKLTKEETLLRKRIRERERYEKIKNDPAKYEMQKEKERRKYENKKKKKQVKLVKEMSSRELRIKRKQWRKNSLRYLKNKKEQFVLPDSPAYSDEESHINIQPNIASKQKNSGRKQIRRDRSKVIKRNKMLLLKISRLKTKLERYKKRYYRLADQSKKNDTPRTKVETLMKSKDKDRVRRRLLFGLALEHQLKDNYKAIDSKNKKKGFLKSVLGDKVVLKKCQVLKDLRHIFTKRLVPMPSIRSIVQKKTSVNCNDRQRGCYKIFYL